MSAMRRLYALAAPAAGDEPGPGLFMEWAIGKQGEIIWQFTKAGEVKFACLYPGHYDAGMKGQVTVVKK